MSCEHRHVCMCLLTGEVRTRAWIVEESAAMWNSSVYRTLCDCTRCPMNVTTIKQMSVFLLLSFPRVLFILVNWFLAEHFITS